MRLRAALGLALTAAVALSACSGDGEEPTGPDGTSSAAVTTDPAEAEPAQIAFPPTPAAVLAGPTPSDLAIQASQTLFAFAPVAVLTAAGADPSDASSLAIELGMPLLLSPATASTPSEPTAPSQSPSSTSTPPTTPADDGSAVLGELDRLGASIVVAVGGDAAHFAEN